MTVSTALVILLLAHGVKSWSADKFLLVGEMVMDLATHLEARCLILLMPPAWLQQHDTKLFALAKLLTSSPRLASAFFTYPQFILRRQSKPISSCQRPFIAFLDGGSETALAFEQLSGRYGMSTSIWLVFPDCNIEDFFKNSFTPFDTEVITAYIQNDGSVNIHEVYRTHPKQNLQEVEFGNWTKSGRLNAHKGHLYTRRTNLGGLVLRTVSLENWPVSTFEGTHHLSKESWDGYYPRVWRELERLMNCTSVNVRSNTTGVQAEDGSWNGMMAMVLDGEIDVIVSELSINKERSYVLDFSHPLSISRYQVYYKHPGYSLAWNAVFRPLDVDIWIAIALWICAGSLVLYICNLCCVKQGLEDRLGTEWFIPSLSFLFMIQSLSQQGSTKVPSSAVCRIVFLASYVVSAVVIPAYSASLISSLTKQTPFRPFDSFEAMLADGTYKLVVGVNTAEYAHFSKATDTLYMDVYKKLVRTVPKEDVMNNSLDAIPIVCNHSKYAVFGIEEVINARLESLNIPCHVISFSQSLSMVYQSMGLIRGSPYSSIINHHLQKMFDVGVVDRVRKSVWPRAKIDFNPHWSEVQVVDVSQIFIYLVLGQILSTAVFLVEVVVYRRSLAREEKQHYDVTQWATFSTR